MPTVSISAPPLPSTTQPSQPPQSPSSPSQPPPPGRGPGVLTKGLEGTVATDSVICYVFGAEGRLIYRGYDIDDLAEHSTFEETAYLLLNGDLYTPIFAVSRVSGWCAHVLEQHADNRLIRPRAEYVGPLDRRWVPPRRRS